MCEVLRLKTFCRLENVLTLGYCLLNMIIVVMFA